MGRLVIFQGPSGSGKSTLGAATSLSLFPTYTTRTPRPLEIDGRDYHFINKDHLHKFEVAGGGWVELVEYDGNFYGTTKEQLSSLDQGETNYWTPLNLEGVKKYKEFLKTPPLVVGVHVNEFTAYQRLKDRYGNNVEAIARRMSTYREETSHLHNTDVVISTEMPLAFCLKTLRRILAIELHPDCLAGRACDGCDILDCVLRK